MYLSLSIYYQTYFDKKVPWCPPEWGVTLAQYAFKNKGKTFLNMDSVASLLGTIS